MPQGGLASHPTVTPRSHLPRRPDSLAHPADERETAQASSDGAKASVFPGTLDCGRALFGTHVSCLYNATRRPPGPLHAEPGSARGPSGMPQGGLASHPTGIPRVIFHDDPTPRLIPRARGGPRRHPATGPRLPCSPGPWTAGGHDLELMFFSLLCGPQAAGTSPCRARVSLRARRHASRRSRLTPHGHPPKSSSTTIRFPDSSCEARGGACRHPGTGLRLPCSPRPWTAGGPHLELMFPVSIMKPAGRRDPFMPSPVPLEGPPACHKEASPHTPRSSPKPPFRTTRLPGSSRGREGDRAGIPGRGQGFRVPRDPGQREGLIWNSCFLSL